MEMINLYEMEVPHTDIFSKMKQNTYNYYQSNVLSSLDKNYLILRRSLISIISKISNQMGFKSQTYFLAIYYLDLIFAKEKELDLNYGIVSLACLIIASKYSENSPKRPIFKFFVYLYNESQNEIKITKGDLFKYEIIVCKILEYKLNYYTIYDFNFFFFGTGIIKKNKMKEMNYILFSKGIIPNKDPINNTNLKKILIKIYDKSRYYLNNIINNLICLKYNSFFISLHIMEKSIENVLLSELINNCDIIIDNIKKEKILITIKNYFKDLMKEFYKISYDYIDEYRDLVEECENLNIFKNLIETNKKCNQTLSKNKYQNSNILYKKANFSSFQVSSKKIRNNDSFSIKANEKNKEKNYENSEKKEKNITIDVSPRVKKYNIQLHNKNFKRLITNQELLTHLKNINDLNQKFNNLSSTKSKRSIFNYNMIKKSNDSSSSFNKSYSNSNYNNKKKGILYSKIKTNVNMKSKNQEISLGKNYKTICVSNSIDNKLIKNDLKNKLNSIIKPYHKKLFIYDKENKTSINKSNNLDYDKNNDIKLEKSIDINSDKSSNINIKKNNDINSNKNITINININNRILYESNKGLERNFDIDNDYKFGNFSNRNNNERNNKKNWGTIINKSRNIEEVNWAMSHKVSNNNLNIFNSFNDYKKNNKINSNFNVYTTSNTTKNYTNSNKLNQVDDNSNNDNYNSITNDYDDINESVKSFIPKQNKKYIKTSFKKRNNNESKLVKLIRNMRNAYDRINQGDSSFQIHLTDAIFKNSDNDIINSSPLRINTKKEEISNNLSNYKINNFSKIYNNYNSNDNNKDNTIRAYNDFNRTAIRYGNSKQRIKMKLKLPKCFGNSLNENYKK